MRKLKIITETHPDGNVAYPEGIKSVVVGEGDSCEQVLADVRSAIRFSLETFGIEAPDVDVPMSEALVAEATIRPAGKVPGRRHQGAGAPGAAETGFRDCALRATYRFAAPKRRPGCSPLDDAQSSGSLAYFSVRLRNSMVRAQARVAAALS